MDYTVTKLKAESEVLSQIGILVSMSFDKIRTCTNVIEREEEKEELEQDIELIARNKEMIAIERKKISIFDSISEQVCNS